MDLSTPLWGGLLVGGASRRMGAPKQLLAIGGRPLGEIVAAALAPHVEVLCLLGDGEVSPALSALPRLADLPGVRGPLAGVLAALGERPGGGWLLAACDQPWLTAEAVAWLVARRGEGDLAVLPRRAPGRIEPFAGIYEAAAGPALQQIARGRASLQELAGWQGVATPWLPPRWRPAWRGVNTQRELERAGGPDMLRPDDPSGRERGEGPARTR